MDSKTNKLARKKTLSLSRNHVRHIKRTVSRERFRAYCKRWNVSLRNEFVIKQTTEHFFTGSVG